ncbi:phosphohistidine phosphatase SixA [Litorilituus lipolyticus]|uniref:Phosphohistidine phosphatase SixA n=1 Tax=Litorilituus lipolyticus TaxID=2491017 RepID=A0A502L2M2_9GAMM|nr:phosphohistidine phosphatase SixA [Litorilituus lipolyticus]TPH17946.1 phosphohistidine phosphatase SixA [Litorilituus lipolyticus]
MQIFIMRHGEAEPISTFHHMSDFQRSLTKQGQIEAQLMGKWLLNMSNDIHEVFVSPYERAQQTASIMLSSLTSSGQNTGLSSSTLDFITPNDSAQQVHDFIDGYCEQLSDESINSGHAILIVSHMPLVSYLVAEFTNPENAPIFATAAIAEIDYDVKQMKGELVRLISPLDLC